MAVKKAAGETAPKKPTEVAIRKRAQEIYEERLKKDLPGTEESDWLQAERELAGKKS